MTNTILKVSRNPAGAGEPVRALRAAGLTVVEVEDWDRAAETLRACAVDVVVCDPESLDPEGVARAVAARGGAGEGSAALPREVMRALSHDLRTPLSAMAGWLHLIESGKLDEAGLKRAIGKLRGNIEDQVRTIDRYLGTKSQEGRG